MKSMRILQSSLAIKQASSNLCLKSRFFHTSLASSCANRRDAQLWPKATLIPGDGVGPELCNVVQEVFKAAKVPLTFDEHFISEIEPSLSETPEVVIKSIKTNKLCLKGHLASLDHRSDRTGRTLNMALREDLDLFANVVHVQSIEGLASARHKNVDMIVIREQTEGEYSALEHESSKGIVEALKITTAKKCKQIARFAFNYAIKHGRKKVTAVHKANIMKLGDGLFLECCKEVAETYPELEFDNMIIDNCAMQMVSKPHQFDVLVLPNLYGNVIDNLAAGLVGGAGVVPGASYSKNCVVFEPGARHTFSEGQGKNVANPTAMLLAGANMLEYNNLFSYADNIKSAVRKVIRAGKVKTKDIGGNSTTYDFCSSVISNLK